MKEIQKYYKIVNAVFLGICIYIIIFPMISKPLEKIVPSLFSCPYLNITGKPCPLCGGTRFIRNIKKSFGDFRYFLNFFGFIFGILILEIPFRIYNLTKNSYEIRNIAIDFAVHISIAICIVIYEIRFIINS